MHDEHARTAAPIPLSTSQFSCIGERQSNQDAIGYHLDDRFGCFVVSDGVGGHAGGELAARLAVDAALRAFVHAPAIDTQHIRHCVGQANAAILAQQRTHGEHDKMSATFVGLFVDRQAGQVRWAHAGDSRLYALRRGLVAQRTEDHSLSRRSREETAPHDAHGEAAAPGNGARALIGGNLLYRALGARATVEASVSDIHPVTDGDAFLLCTDGLWQLIAQQVMERSLQLADSAEEWLALLRRAAEARAADSRDNYSALAVWVGYPQQITLMGALA